MSNAAWNFTLPTRVHFGAGRLAELPSITGDGRALLVTTQGSVNRGLAARVTALLGAHRVTLEPSIRPNPGLADLDTLIHRHRATPCEIIVALGGGSVIDAAKALSVGLTAGRDWTLRAHFSNSVAPPSAPSMPVIAIPTTAGTGSEVTPFATIWDHEIHKKLSLVSPTLNPRAALLDPELTLDLPLEASLHCGLDSLAQGLESIWNRNASPASLGLAMQCVTAAWAVLPQLAAHPRDLAVRSRMLEASVLSGLAISQTRTALAHSISYPLTAHFGVPHGLACAFTLPALLDFNTQADDGRLLTIARILGFSSIASFHASLTTLLEQLGVSKMLNAYIPSPAALLPLVGEMFTPGRADNNLRPATGTDIAAIIRHSFPE